MPRVAGQVGKVLGEKWKALDQKQREPYEAKATADKKRYENEKASYNNVSLEPFLRALHDVGANHVLITQAAEDEEEEE